MIFDFTSDSVRTHLSERRMLGTSVHKHEEQRGTELRRASDRTLHCLPKTRLAYCTTFGGGASSSGNPAFSIATSQRPSHGGLKIRLLHDWETVESARSAASESHWSEFEFASEYSEIWDAICCTGIATAFVKQCLELSQTQQGAQRPHRRKRCGTTWTRPNSRAATTRAASSAGDRFLSGASCERRAVAFQTRRRPCMRVVPRTAV